MSVGQTSKQSLLSSLQTSLNKKAQGFSDALDFSTKSDASIRQSQNDKPGLQTNDINNDRKRDKFNRVFDDVRAKKNRNNVTEKHNDRAERVKDPKKSVQETSSASSRDSANSTQKENSANDNTANNHVNKNADNRNSNTDSMNKSRTEGCQHADKKDFKNRDLAEDRVDEQKDTTIQSSRKNASDTIQPEPVNSIQESDEKSISFADGLSEKIKSLNKITADLAALLNEDGKRFTAMDDSVINGISENLENALFSKQAGLNSSDLSQSSLPLEGELLNAVNRLQGLAVASEQLGDTTALTQKELSAKELADKALIEKALLANGAAAATALNQNGNKTGDTLPLTNAAIADESAQSLLASLVEGDADQLSAEHTASKHITAGQSLYGQSNSAQFNSGQSIAGRSVDGQLISELSIEGHAGASKQHQQTLQAQNGLVDETDDVLTKNLSLNKTIDDQALKMNQQGQFNGSQINAIDDKALSTAELDQALANTQAKTAMLREKLSENKLLNGQLSEGELSSANSSANKLMTSAANRTTSAQDVMDANKLQSAVLSVDNKLSASQSQSLTAQATQSESDSELASRQLNQHLNTQNMSPQHLGAKPLNPNALGASSGMTADASSQLSNTAMENKLLDARGLDIRQGDARPIDLQTGANAVTERTAEHLVESKTDTVNKIQMANAAQQETVARTATVKTGLSPQLSNLLSNPQWANAIADKVLSLASKNIQSAEVQLDPAELGQIQIKINMHQEMASVNFVSANASVREALDASSSRLREMFQQEGLDLVDVGVSDQSKQQNSFEGDQQASQDNDSRGGNQTLANRNGDNGDTATLEEPIHKTTLELKNWIDFYA